MLFEALDELLEFLFCEIAVDCAVDHDCGCFGAGADAPDYFKSDETVFGGLSGLDIEEFFS